MIENLKQSLWKHFAASIDMLGNAISMWPEAYWFSERKFFFNAYHCLVFLDYYLTIPPVSFTAPLPYTLTDPANLPEDAIDDVVPDRIYSKEEMLGYLHASRQKLRLLLQGLTEEKLSGTWIDNSEHLNLDLCSSAAMNYSVLDILFYNLRHVQHHTAQLNMLLRQKIDAAPDYVSTPTDSLAQDAL